MHRLPTPGKRPVCPRVFPLFWNPNKTRNLSESFLSL